MVAATPDAAAQPVPLTEDDCTKMIDHVLDLAVAVQKQKHPDRELHDDAIAAVRKQLHDELMPKCVGGDRRQYDCFMAATDIDQVTHCTEI